MDLRKADTWAPGNKVLVQLGAFVAFLMTFAHFFPSYHEVTTPLVAGALAALAGYLMPERESLYPVEDPDATVYEVKV
jgi:hypothetical protein